MSAKLGNKRNCPSCGAKYYDLGKTQSVCPKCGYVSIASEARPIKVKTVKAAVKLVRKEEKQKKKQHIDETNDDIDLSKFEDAEPVGALNEIETIEEPDESDIVSLEGVEERERKEDNVNTDDAEEDALIETLEESETLVDKPVTEENDEEEEEK